MSDRKRVVALLRGLGSGTLMDRMPIPTDEDPAVLADIALTESEPLVRKNALIVLDKFPKKLDFVVLERFLDLVDGSAKDEQPEVIVRMMQLIGRNPNARLARSFTLRLERVLWASDVPDVRRAAFRLMEQFGEIDCIGRLSMLPCTQPDDLASLQRVMGAVLRKRRWVRALRPVEFEVLIARVLERRRPEYVWSVVNRTPDHGVDVEGRKRGGGRVMKQSMPDVLVQCKNRRSLREEHLRDFIDKTSIFRDGVERVFVTSSPKSMTLASQAESHGIQIVFKTELQAWLDEYAPGAYRVDWETREIPESA